MAFTLRMIFGGLCLFVEQEDVEARGMFVLMPNMSMPGMEHETVAAFDSGHLSHEAQTGTLKRVPLLHERVRVTGIVSGGNKQGLPSTMAPVSRYGGGPIRKEWITMPRPEGLLAARVELDLGVVAETFGSDGLLEFDHAGGVEQRRVHGLASVTVPVPDGIDSIEVAGIKLYPRDGSLSVGFFNVPGGRLTQPPRAHAKGERMRHFEAYYWMLGRSGPVPRAAEASWFPGGSILPVVGAGLFTGAVTKDDPRIKQPIDRRDFVGAVVAFASMSALGGNTSPRVETRRGLERVYVDPVDCTVGGGCSESDPGCT